MIYTITYILKMNESIDGIDYFAEDNTISFVSDIDVEFGLGFAQFEVDRFSVYDTTNSDDEDIIAQDNALEAFDHSRHLRHLRIINWIEYQRMAPFTKGRVKTNLANKTLAQRYWHCTFRACTKLQILT